VPAVLETPTAPGTSPPAGGRRFAGLASNGKPVPHHAQAERQTMPDESTSEMPLGNARLIECISEGLFLPPGDIIGTGSAGKDMHHNRFLRPGENMAGQSSGRER